MNNKEIEKQLCDNVWNKSRDYYDIAHNETVKTFKKNEAMRLAAANIPQKGNFLDVGCGEGTTLNLLSPEFKFGCDLSFLALETGKEKYKDSFFIRASASKLPFKNNSFKGSATFYSVEHFVDAESVIKEMIRVTDSGGKIIIIGPNYGSPINKNPFKRENRKKFFIRRFFLGFYYLLFKKNTLNWENNIPEYIYSEKIRAECDIVANPYLGTLLNFLKASGVKITDYSACWSWDDGNETFLQKVFRFLAKFRMPPFIYFGPQFCVVGEVKRL